MVNQDQNDLNMQQDFDEFDNLVNDEFDMLEEMDYADNSGNRKKRQTLFYLVLVFMLLVGGGAAWFLFFRPADTVTPLPMPGSTPPSAESMTAPPALDGLPPGVSTPEETAKSDLREATQNMDMTGDVQNFDAMPPADSSFDNAAQDPALSDLPPAEVTAPVDGTLVEALPPPTEPAAEDIAALPQAIDAEQPIVPAPVAPAEIAANVTDTDAVVAEQGIMPTPNAENTFDNVATAPQDNTAVVNTPDPTLQQRLVDMENHIQNLTQELQQLRNAAPVAANAQSGVSDAQLQELNQKLDRLTQQVDALDQRTTTFATELQQRADAPAPAVVTPRAIVAEPKKAATPKASKPKAAAKPAPRKNVVGGWELRSAQPGVAWLGRQGVNEMGRYAVGQNVPGLGTVEAVTQEGGRWIVKTTGGTLRQ